MWKTLRLMGEDGWLKRAIERGTLVAVTDGSYMRELLPSLCSAAFILKCSEGSGRIVGSFAEASRAANAYRGELLGLMAIHLILLAGNKLWPELEGRAVVFSDCLGALGRVANLPPPQHPNTMQTLRCAEEHPGELHRPDVQCQIRTCACPSRRPR